MKKISFIVVMLVVFVFTASAEEWLNFNDRGESAPIYDVTNSTSSIVEFELEIPGMESEEIDNFNRIYIPEHTKLDSIGFPEVPVITYLIAIPECDNVNLNVTVLDSIVIDNINIYPAPEWIEVNNGDYIYLEEQFTINNAFYNTNTYFPGYTGELVDKGLVRDQNCIRVTLYPVQFNPAQQQVIAYSRVNIEMTFENASGSVNNNVGIFNEVCGSAMINYDSNGLNASVSCGAGYTDIGEIHFVETFGNSTDGKFIIENCDYLIVTHHEFWDSPDLYNLAQKKANYNGFDVVIVKMIDIEEQVSTPDNWPYEKLKYLIRNTYNHGSAEHTFDGKLGYVNLFSDVMIDTGAQHPVPTYEDGNDVYFSQLTEIGGFADKYPDILLGRCSVGNIEEVTNVCTKICNYEPIDRNEQGYDEWNERMTFVTGKETTHLTTGLNMIAPFVDSFDTMVLTDNQFLNSFPNFDDTDYFDSDNLLGQYDYGNLIITYMGHGSPNYWAWPEPAQYSICYNDVVEAQIDNRLPFIFSMACYTGQFHTTDNCMSEEFTLASSTTGSIGFIGSSDLSNSGSFDNFVPYCFEALSEGMAMCGEMLLAAKLKTTCVSYINHYNLIGDPALNILLDSENILNCDLICNEQEITIEDIDNQILSIAAGVTNSSLVDIEDDIIIECQLINNFAPLSLSTFFTIEGLSSMDTESANFTFNISDCMPTEFEVKIIVDPENLIQERNEENNEGEKEHDYYSLQEGFPAIIFKNLSYGNIPLYHDNSIILNGTKISTSGELIWDSGFSPYDYSLPISNNDSYDYIMMESGWNLHRLNGNNGGIVNNYIVNGAEDVFRYFCLGDLNNDGEYELITGYREDLQETYLTDIVIFDLDGNILFYDTMNHIQDIAIGDGNNDGKNEIYITRGVNIIEKYDYVNGTITLLNSAHVYPHTIDKIALDDFNDDGYLDCAVFSDTEVRILNCSDLSLQLGAEFDLTSDLGKYALGDIDNDGVTEIVITQNSNVPNSTDIYTIDVNESGYQYLFSEDDPFIDEDSRIMLCDLNSDYNLDIILSESRSINGYLSNGELIFAFPDNRSKTHNTVVDIDNDGDIEIVFGERTKEFNQNGDTKLIASDIDVAYSNIGNIYPRMNELGNNLFSQPVTGQLSENTDYYWSESITLHGDVTLPINSTLTILQGTIIKAKENSKLICHGELNINGIENQPVKFEPIIQDVSEDYWQGLEFPEGNAEVELNHVVIKNANLYSERDIVINGGSFINTPLVQDNQSLWLTDVDFDNSPITADLYGLTALEIVSIISCNINNLTMDAGIEITGYPNFNISYNSINYCNSGIKLWRCGSGINNTISNNMIRNNSQNFGIFAYNSYVDIQGFNKIENNRIGLFISRDSNFNLIGSEYSPHQMINNNNEQEILFSYDSRPSQFYYNMIFDDDHDYNYVKCINIPLFHESIDISNNNWGYSFNPETDLSPLWLFTYQPMWDPGIIEDLIYGSETEMYLSAKQHEEDENYPAADQTYKQIISIYPESKYAKIAAKELLALQVKSDLDFIGLKLYYENEPNMQHDDEMIRLSEFLITCCNVKLEEFQSAIDWFEEIIQDPPSTVDSVFAVIDAGYTYLLIENSRALCVGEIPELKPESRKQHKEKRDELINMLFGNSEPDNEIPPIYKLALYSNYPNPFNPSTTIEFSLPKESNVELSVYNIRGQKVKTLVKDEFESGKHSVIWFGKDNNNKKCSSGIYFYQLKVNGKSKSVKKCLLLK